MALAILSDRDTSAYVVGKAVALSSGVVAPLAFFRFCNSCLRCCVSWTHTGVLGVNGLGAVCGAVFATGVVGAGNSAFPMFAPACPFFLTKSEKAVSKYPPHAVE